MIKVSKLMGFSVFSLIMVALIFFVCEGLSSTIFIARRVLVHEPPLAERLHTEYDETLGWINLPNTYVEDMYGPGVYLKTNGQRFRNNEDFSLRIPRRKQDYLFWRFIYTRLRG